MRRGLLQAGSSTESTTWIPPSAQAMSCMPDSLGVNEGVQRLLDERRCKTCGLASPDGLAAHGTGAPNGEGVRIFGCPTARHRPREPGRPGRQERSFEGRAPPVASHSSRQLVKARRAWRVETSFEAHELQCSVEILPVQRFCIRFNGLFDNIFVSIPCHL